MIDWIADYYERVESFPVMSQVQPGEVRGKLPDAPPIQGEPFERVMEDVERVILPGITHWQSPNFFAFFPANASGPGILGELLSAGLGVQGMIWATSPACTELETHVLDWLVDMLALPEAFKSTQQGGGVIQDTASSASLCAILVGREQATGYATNQRGCDGRLTVYTSAEAHSSIEKGAKIAGIGAENVRLVPVDNRLAMQPEALARMIEEDRAAGYTPCLVAATVGTTSTNAIDPIAEIGDLCRREKIWFHVDAAMSGTAALCPEFRYIHRGLAKADSYCFNPHKWMLTNFDCSCFFVKDRRALIDTLSILPVYLRNAATESGSVIDYRDWHIQLGRRFRALKLWFVIRYYGVAGLQQHVRRHVALAQSLADWIQEDPNFELSVEPPLNLVCFRHIAGDEATRMILDRLNESGKMYLTQTKTRDQFVIRLCIGQPQTNFEHVQKAWREIQKIAKEVAP